MLVRSLPSGTIYTAVHFCHTHTHTQGSETSQLSCVPAGKLGPEPPKAIPVSESLIHPKPALRWLTACEQTLRGSEQKVGDVCSKWRQQSWTMPVYLVKDTAIGPGAPTPVAEGPRGRRRGHQGGKWSQEEMKWTRLGGFISSSAVNTSQK